MAEPSWWNDLTGVSPVLAAEDRAEVAEWGDEEIPLTVRLAHAARSFARHARELSGEQRRQVLGVLETVLAGGSELDGNAVATGFFEALLAAADRGFDLQLVWDDLGPESRAYCEAWDKFTGVRRHLG